MAHLELKKAIDRAVLPATMIPSFRTAMAIEKKVENNLLLTTWGGIGDQACSEPTLRHAFKAFKNCRISLQSPIPELFSHLPFHEVFDSKNIKPNLENYFEFRMIEPPTHLTWEFFSHCLTNCVDYPSLCAFRMQLPVSEREIYLTGQKRSDISFTGINPIFVHAGKHWPSKTFPKDWWDETLSEIIKMGLTPVLIGADADDNRGTVDVNTTGCLDLRNKLSVTETIWLLQRAKVLLTNDSSPLHMAASTDPNEKRTTGHCHIRFIATCKHPDYITHWRKGIWQYREINLGLGGIWDMVDHCPNQKEEIKVDQVDERVLRSWLPTPKSVAESVKEASDNFWKH
jgi:hypothetical protein